MNDNVKMIMGTGQGFDCLTVKSEESNVVDGYSNIKSVVNTLAIDDFQDEMHVPSNAILIKSSYLRDLESEIAEENLDSSNEDDDSTMFGPLLYVKTVAYDDVEMSLVAYGEGTHITAFHIKKGVRTLLGNKFFNVDKNDWGTNAEADVVKYAFNGIESYEDATRFIANFAMDEETVKQLREGFVADDTAVTFVENAWELKENEDGQKEDE